jgi:hypothetical protein
MATFLHTRRFLAYHGDRFADASLFLTTDTGTTALLPAAIDPDSPSGAISHPGITYGGLIHDGKLNGDRTIEALRAVSAHYAEQGIGSLRYKPVPHIYHRAPGADDVWALWMLGARRTRADISCAIDLDGRRTPSTRRQRSFATARRSGVEVASDPARVAEFWDVLVSTLARRHKASPVHSVEEIELLRSRFPDEIRVVVALHGDEVVAGTVLFNSAMVFHTQYMAASEAGMRVRALDAVIEHCIDAARDAGARYFDFGTSAVPGARRLLPGLYRWKAEFGGGGVLYEEYELPLET